MAPVLLDRLRLLEKHLRQMFGEDTKVFLCPIWYGNDGLKN